MKYLLVQHQNQEMVNHMLWLLHIKIIASIMWQSSRSYTLSTDLASALLYLVGSHYVLNLSYHQKLNDILRFRWYQCCYTCNKLGMKSQVAYNQSKLALCLNSEKWSNQPIYMHCEPAMFHCCMQVHSPQVYCKSVS